jgi:UDP:flavonoid glycosyltransferase YjiC (YdhE family)
MKMRFIFPNLPDHLNPMTALARRLQARKHEFVMLCSSSTNGLLGGAITNASELGQGSRFSFEIARRGADPVSAELRPTRVIGYEGPRRRILVVDDEPLNRSMLSVLSFDGGI